MQGGRRSPERSVDLSISRLSSAALQAKADVTRAISVAAERTGVDFNYLYAQAKSESGLDPDVKAASSSASGLYQFIDQSWLGIVKQHGSEHGFGWAANAISRDGRGRWHVDPEMKQAVFGLRNQAGPAALMAAEYAGDNAAGLARSLGRSIGGTDLYFAHFLGLGGATKFLKRMDADPDASAAAAFPREAAANRSIFYDRTGNPRSLSDVYRLMGNKLAKAGGGAAQPLPAATPQPAPEVQMALADPADSAKAEPDTAERLAALGSAKIDLLRPSPATARLAYLMLTSGTLA